MRKWSIFLTPTWRVVTWYSMYDDPLLKGGWLVTLFLLRVVLETPRVRVSGLGFLEGDCWIVSRVRVLECDSKMTAESCWILRSSYLVRTVVSKNSILARTRTYQRLPVKCDWIWICSTRIFTRTSSGYRSCEKYLHIPKITRGRVL